jgi:hypothetical protein
MNKIAAYQVALDRIETEKRAEALIDAYGTSEGFMPESYLLAFDRMEKEGGFKVLQEFGKGLLRSGAKGARETGSIVKATRDASGNVVKGSGGWTMNQGMGAGDQLKYLGNRMKMGLGRRLQTTGGQAALGAAGAAGTAGLGYGGYRMLKD